MISIAPFLACVVALALTVTGTPVGAQAVGPSDLLNVSFDATRDFYAEYNRAFEQDWERRTGSAFFVRQSHGGSGAQARAVMDGLPADVVTLGLASDIDLLARNGLIGPQWRARLPGGSVPFWSTVVFLVRSGNPKRLHDWDDLVKPEVALVAANPKTSGGARWAFLAAWAYARAHGAGDAAAEAFVTRLYGNAVVLDAGTRASALTFAKRGIGDVLIGWESEAHFIERSMPGRFAIVTPSVSVRAEPPVAWVDRNVEARGTLAAASAYLRGLYGSDAQMLACRVGFRPTLASVARRCSPDVLPTYLARIDRDFGGWQFVQSRFFSKGGIVDRVGKPH